MTSEISDRARIAELEKEMLEQARLNGMGSEREARLMAKLTELRKHADAMRYKIAEAWIIIDKMGGEKLLKQEIIEIMAAYDKWRKDHA